MLAPIAYHGTLDYLSGAPAVTLSLCKRRRNSSASSLSGEGVVAFGCFLPSPIGLGHRLTPAACPCPSPGVLSLTLLKFPSVEGSRIDKNLLHRTAGPVC